METLGHRNIQKEGKERHAHARSYLAALNPYWRQRRQTPQGEFEKEALSSARTASWRDVRVTAAAPVWLASSAATTSLQGQIPPRPSMKSSMKRVGEEEMLQGAAPAPGARTKPHLERTGYPRGSQGTSPGTTSHFPYGHLVSYRLGSEEIFEKKRLSTGTLFS